MRTIAISTGVFAKIWALREENEETEDDVLRRVLDDSKPRSDGGNDATPPGGGFTDPRSGVHFPEGFEIFRNYKGTNYRASSTRGRWLLLNSNQSYPSLHKLSWAVVHGHENSWTKWKFDNPDGGYRLIASLRDPTKVATRKPYTRLEDF